MVSKNLAKKKWHISTVSMAIKYIKAENANPTSTYPNKKKYHTRHILGYEHAIL